MTKATTNILSLLLIFTLAGCSLPGSATPAPGQTAAPTAIPEPLPTGYTELLQAKVASGEWTMETGLVTMLQLFAGEIPASQAGLGEGVLDTEGTGVLQMAGSYLQTGSDQAAKDEITRLVDLLVPTQEALDRYTIPEEQASVRAPGRAAPALPQEEIECEGVWLEGFPDPPTPIVPCFMLHIGSVGLDSYQVYSPWEWQGDDSREVYYTATKEAIRASFTEYQKYSLVGPIYFVFSNQDLMSHLDTLVLAYYKEFRPATQACPIIIYPGALTDLDPKAYQQKIAHEIFHCVQVRTFHDQLLGPGMDSLWWSEGTAEYFSNLVYPAVNSEHRFKDSFLLDSASFPLMNMGHENFAFFQFMGTTLRPEGVIDLLTYMPVTPGREAQTAALAAYPGIEDYFDQFVRSVLDKTLVDTDGTTIPFLTRYTDQFTFVEITSKTFPSQEPFVISRYWVTFASEREFALYLEINPVGQGRSGVRFIDGKVGDWLGIFPEIVGGCDPLQYVLYVITTTPGSERAETVSTTTVTDAPCDRCLIGSWEATNESMMAYMQSVLAPSTDGSVSIESATGSMFLNFEATGTGAGGYKDLVLHQTGSEYIEGSDVIVTFDGSSSGRYTADGAVLTGLSDITTVSFTVEILLNGTSLGSTTTPIRPEDFPVGSATPTSYTCEGDTLTTWPPVEGVVVEPVVWTRSSP